MIVKVVETKEGPFPVFQVMKEVVTCDVCEATENVVIESFDNYAQADAYCDALVADGKAADKPQRLPGLLQTTACGEEQP